MARATRVFIGTCGGCTIPVRVELPDAIGDHTNVTCLDCHTPLAVERLYATVTQGSCDVRCMGASGMICECACGGENHAGAWARNKIKGEERASYIARLLKQREERAERKIKRERAKISKKKSDFQQWLDSFENELERDALVELIDGDEPENDFLSDIRSRLVRNEILTEKQSAAVLRVMQREQERAERKIEEQKNAKPAPSGRVEIAGEIISRRFDGDGGWDGRGSYKILIKCDGFKIWGSCPKSAIQHVWPPYSDYDANRGKCPVGLKIKMRATLKPKDGDESFAFFSRPSNVDMIETIPASNYEVPEIMNREPGTDLQKHVAKMCPDVIGTERIAWTGHRVGQTGTIVRVNGISRTILDWSDGTTDEYDSSDLMLPEHYKGERWTPESVSETPKISAPKSVTGDAPAPVAKRSGSHSECQHESTKSARAKCRRERNAK